MFIDIVNALGTLVVCPLKPFSSCFHLLSITLMIYLVCCVCVRLFLFCLYLKGVYFVNDLSVCPAGESVPRLCQHSAWGMGSRLCVFVWGWRDWRVEAGGVGVTWHRAQSSAHATPAPLSPPSSSAWQNAFSQTCESLSMPVQTAAKKRGLAVIRIDCLVLCLPIYIMDLSHSMMFFCQVLPH